LADERAGQIAKIGIPQARAESIRAVARAVARGQLELVPATNLAAVDALVALPGIGDWTAQYVAMRALRWPDAFPASDLGLRKASGVKSERELRKLSERWRPWRAYAAMYLWQTHQASSR
jgi:AraC family transcriptional regulator of adaptative response / DNA-3-methyladenine glycosylase II